MEYDTVASYWVVFGPVGPRRRTADAQRRRCRPRSRLTSTSTSTSARTTGTGWSCATAVAQKFRAERRLYLRARRGDQRQLAAEGPLFSGESAVEAYLPSQKIWIAVAVTYQPEAFDGTAGAYDNVADQLWRQIGIQLPPTDPRRRGDRGTSTAASTMMSPGGWFDADGQPSCRT